VAYKTAKDALYQQQRDKIYSNLSVQDYNTAAQFTWDNVNNGSLNEGGGWDWLTGDSSWASDKGKIAGMLSLAETIRESEFSDMSYTAQWNVANYLVALRRAAKSSNSEIRSIAKFIISGLPVGMQEAIADEDWNGGVKGLGAHVGSAIADEVETHSPSEMTKRIGRYVIEGLAVGMQEGIAEQDWSGTVGGLGELIETALKAELTDTSKGTAALWSEQITKAGDKAYTEAMSKWTTEHNGSQMAEGVRQAEAARAQAQADKAAELT